MSLLKIAGSVDSRKATGESSARRACAVANPSDVRLRPSAVVLTSLRRLSPAGHPKTGTTRDVRSSANTTHVSLVRQLGTQNGTVFQRRISVEDWQTASTAAAPGRGSLSASRAWFVYNRALEQNPLLTKAVVMALGLALGDVLAQVLATGDASNLTRTAHIAFFGLAFQGPAVHYLHTFLDRHVAPEAPTSAWAVLAKVSVDQGMFAPVAVAAYISFGQLVGSGVSPDGIAMALENSWASTLQANYMLWPAALLFNYSLCPPQHRILFINMVTVFWSAFLSTSTS